MKKIINGNSGCENCINSNVNSGCDTFINKMVANGLKDCTQLYSTSNYVYSEKENEMKLTKAQKQELKNRIQSIINEGGFIHIFENGITRVYIPTSKARNNRMFFYGQSVCNSEDKYKRKLGIALAIQDFDDSFKMIPIELLRMEEDYSIEYIG